MSPEYLRRLAELIDAGDVLELDAEDAASLRAMAATLETRETCPVCGYFGCICSDPHAEHETRETGMTMGIDARIRREIRDKLSVAQSTHSGLILRQIEDYLLEIIKNGGTDFIDRPPEGVPQETTAPVYASIETLQPRVVEWIVACFGAQVAGDVTERNHRFLEEALELVQATGCMRASAHQLVDYVYDRPAGEAYQEVGGTLLTLAALCGAVSIDMAAAGYTELARAWTAIEKIRAKQAAKPKHGPLPQVPPSAGADPRERLAAYAYEAWSGWMRYLFEHSTLNADGTVTIPAWAADRWRRQAGTLYEDLSDVEQESDRKEAARMFAIMWADPPPAPGSETPNMEFALRYAVALIEGQLSVAASAHKDILLQHIQSLREAEQRLVTLTEELEYARREKQAADAHAEIYRKERDQLTEENQALRERLQETEQQLTFWKDASDEVHEHWQGDRNRAEAAEARIQQLTEENVALRERERTAFEAGRWSWFSMALSRWMFSPQSEQERIRGIDAWDAYHRLSPSPTPEEPS